MRQIAFQKTYPESREIGRRKTEVGRKREKERERNRERKGKEVGDDYSLFFLVITQQNKIIKLGNWR